METDIIKAIAETQHSLEQQLPVLRSVAEELIASESRDHSSIELLLDVLLGMSGFGVGVDLFFRLLDYYETIRPEGAVFYRHLYGFEES